MDIDSRRYSTECWLTASEAAGYIGCSRVTIYEWIRSGQVLALKADRWLIHPDSVRLARRRFASLGRLLKRQRPQEQQWGQYEEHFVLPVTEEEWFKCRDDQALAEHGRLLLRSGNGQGSAIIVDLGMLWR